MAVREHNMTQVAQSFTNTSLKFFTAGISLMWTPTLGQNLRIFKGTSINRSSRVVS